MLPVAVGRSSSGGAAIRYVFPVFIDDVKFARKPRLLDIAWAQRLRSLGLGYKRCAVMPAAGQRTHGTTFRTLKVTPGGSTGAESAVYDCLIVVNIIIKLHLHKICMHVESNEVNELANRPLRHPVRCTWCWPSRLSTPVQTTTSAPVHKHHTFYSNTPLTEFIIDSAVIVQSVSLLFSNRVT